MEKTEVIKKIVAFTNSLKIRGEINEMENNRLSDILNSKDNSKVFLPINNAIVTILRNNETTKVAFLSLNKNAIEVIYEDR